ncbi:PREDICTED: putative ferric-chelate reductase 1 homolog isoform X1 [Amphimedon queenslandica]|uniref:Cytochrome b561 domain-containing protein n=1 Tax=Amphimedon queenslandica TaxID=400682 RepID=A0AAN0IWX3_AMPQE|nr:PREDICTED: putative ferric-chelate reductase 1 homolog isoform X1 [Amphimedon queenslandica]XP_019849275.1 PREDICTED: putative ferric-chelate reductase 1 homolog isoform X1 [Amphimedon queenslandica]|eukprot:XP_019849274.1 PREDICTED: putative ferric-chelate reductase 1 homolog isoform X1 [Amphimedon queenslandica]
MEFSSIFSLFVLFSFILARDLSQASRQVQPRHEEDQGTMDTCYPSNVVYPHRCQGNECTMSLSWRDHEEWVEFNLTAKTQGHSVWVALGFSEDGEMANSDVVTCWYNHGFEIHTAWTSSIGHSLTLSNDNKDSVALLSANYSNGAVSCHFSKRKVPLSNSSIHVKSLSQKNWHILLSWGQLAISRKNDVSMSQHAVKFSTSCPCDVSDCYQMCLCVNQLRFLLFKLHGSIMIIVFVFLLPLATIIARYYRDTFRENWFKSHMTLMLSGVVGMILGLGFILGHTGGKFYVGPHQLIGIIAIGFSVIQAFIAVFRPHAGKSLKRKLFTFFHRLNAVTILLLGTIALFWGTWYIHKEHKMALLWMYSLLSTALLLFLLIVLFLELRQYRSKCTVINPPVKYRKLDHPSSDTEDEDEIFVKENPQESSKKHYASPYFKEKVIFLLYLLQSFTLTGLLSAFIFYRTSEEN